MGKLPLGLAGGHGASLDIHTNNCLHWVILYQTVLPQKGTQRAAALVPNVREGLVAINHSHYSSPRRPRTAPLCHTVPTGRAHNTREAEALPDATKVTAGAWQGRARKAGVPGLPPRALGITHLLPSASQWGKERKMERM